VPSHDNPRCFLAVHRGKVVLQPSELRAIWSEWAGVLLALALWFVRCMGKVGLGVELDEVHHSIVPGKPKVLKTAG
jgi:hypothetical protein